MLRTRLDRHRRTTCGQCPSSNPQSNVARRRSPSPACRDDAPSIQAFQLIRNSVLCRAESERADATTRQDWSPITADPTFCDLRQVYKHELITFWIPSIADRCSQCAQSVAHLSLGALGVRCGDRGCDGARASRAWRPLRRDAQRALFHCLRPASRFRLRRSAAARAPHRCGDSALWRQRLAAAAARSDRRDRARRRQRGLRETLERPLGRNGARGGGPPPFRRRSPASRLSSPRRPSSLSPGPRSPTASPARSRSASGAR